VRIPLLERLSFTGQFVVFSLAVLLLGMFTIGYWVQSAVEQAVISRTAGVTALYMDSFVSPLVQDLQEQEGLTAAQRTDLDRLITRTPLGSQVVSFKIWSPEGVILYSTNPELIGRRFESGDDLEQAFSGEVVSKVSSLTEPENVYERAEWDKLIETYAPIRSDGTGLVFAVSEFYQLPDALEAEVRNAQIRGWAIVGVATLLMYLLLVGMVRRASTTIRRQQADLVEKVNELRDTLDENRLLQDRVSKAAARTTTLNEQFLRRISTDLHDGPAQDVALALLRIEEIAEVIDGNGYGSRDDVDRLRTALDSALTDIRAITHSLRTPSVENLAPCEAARRAVTDFERISGESVVVECAGSSMPAPAPVNITIYRVVQESLANSLKHAGAASRVVRVTVADTRVDVEVSDDGSGFDTDQVSDGSTLGLAGMRERVELLGGSFTVTSRHGDGTVVKANLPLTPTSANA
jgi:signal transduction histidine kinase